MTKKLVILLIVLVLLGLTVVPALAFSSIQFLVTDNKTSQPWGTVAGQSYRIFISGSASGTLLDTGTLTTPADPVLDFTCAYGGACPPGAATTLTTPAAGETVTIYIILTGTTDNPSTIIRSYDQPPIDLGTYTINAQSGTGPTAIRLQSFTSSGSQPVLPSVAGLVAIVLAGTTIVLVRRRRRTTI